MHDIKDTGVCSPLPNLLPEEPAHFPCRPLSGELVYLSRSSSKQRGMGRVRIRPGAFARLLPLDSDVDFPRPANALPISLASYRANRVDGRGSCLPLPIAVLSRSSPVVEHGGGWSLDSVPLETADPC